MKNQKNKDGYHSLRNYRDEEMFQGSSVAHGQHINLFPPNLSSEMGALVAVGCEEMLVWKQEGLAHILCPAFNSTWIVDQFSSFFNSSNNLAKSSKEQMEWKKKKKNNL